MEAQVSKIGPDGRVLIPADYRHQLHLEPGTPVVLQVEGDRLQIYAIQEIGKKAQALVQQYSKGQSLIKLLKQQRAEDSEHE